MFYTFTQNNSGGHFIGPHHVIIEANNAEEANFVAEGIGIYFDGCEKDIDCNCCGDRWQRVSEGAGTYYPQIYDMIMVGTVEEIIENNTDVFASYNYYECDIYYMDRQKKELRFNQDDYRKSMTKAKKKRSKKPFKYGWRFYQDWKKPTRVYKAYADDNDGDIFWANNGNDDLIVSKTSNWLVRDIEGGEIIYYAADTKEEAEASRKAFAEFLAKFNKRVLEMLKHQSHPAIKALANRYK